MFPLYNLNGFFKNDQFKSIASENLNVEHEWLASNVTAEHVHIEQTCIVNELFCSNGNVNVCDGDFVMGGKNKIFVDVQDRWCTKNAFMDLVITNDVHVKNNTKFDKNVYIVGDLEMEDACIHKYMILDGSLYVSKTLLADTINIFKDAIFDKNVLVGGDLIGNEIVSTGKSIFDDVVEIDDRLNVFQLQVDNDTMISGSIVVNSQLNVGRLSLGNIISSDYHVHVHDHMSCKTLNVNQNAYINNNVMLNDGIIVNNSVCNNGMIHIVDAPLDMYHSDLKINDGVLICDHRDSHENIDDNFIHAHDPKNNMSDFDTISNPRRALATFKTENIDISSVILSSHDFDQSPIHCVWRQIIDPLTWNKENIDINNIETYNVGVSMGMGRYRSSVVPGNRYPKNVFCFERHVDDDSTTVFYYNQSNNQFVFDHDGTTNTINPSIKTARICLLKRFQNPNPDARSIWYKQNIEDDMPGLPYWGPDLICLQSEIKKLGRAKSTRFSLENQVFYLVRDNQVTNTTAFTFLNGFFTLNNYGLMMIGHFSTDLMIQAQFSENSIQARYVFDVGDDFPIWGLTNTQTYEGTLNVLNSSNEVFLRRNVTDVKGWFTLTIHPGINRQLVMNMGIFRQARQNLGQRTLFQIHGSQIETFVSYPPI